MKFTFLATLAVLTPALASWFIRDYGDCRDNGCPGGTCVSSNSSDPNAGWICEFPTTTASSTAAISDCRSSANGCPGGQCVSSNSSDPNAGYICSFSSASSASSASTTQTVINDCRNSTDGCPGGQCVSSNPSNPNAGYICSFASTTSAMAGSGGTPPTTIAGIAASATTSKNTLSVAASATGVPIPSTAGTTVSTTKSGAGRVEIGSAVLALGGAVAWLMI